ncbi:MAG: DUF3343 domain-containing protein [Sphaerochaetaceae bacterium]|nr:DUF3343 domain-containing protein [Sphaerochaetaceae bacterium]
MENSAEKIIVATFYNHYGAMMLKKALGKNAVLRPVPRALSSSCGTCVFITDADENAVRDASDENIEAIYRKNGDSYTEIWKAL